MSTGTAPAVGYARTLVAANVNTASISNDWSLLEAQAGGGANGGGVGFGEMTSLLAGVHSIEADPKGTFFS